MRRIREKGTRCSHCAGAFPYSPISSLVGTFRDLFPVTLSVRCHGLTLAVTDGGKGESALPQGIHRKQRSSAEFTFFAKQWRVSWTDHACPAIGASG